MSSNSNIAPNRLIRIKNNVNAFLHLFLSSISIIALFLILVFLTVEAVNELNRPIYWIEPFNTPKLLSDLGYSGQVVSYKLLCDLNQLTARVNTDINSYQMLDTWSSPTLDISCVPIILPPKSQKFDILIPKSGLSYNNIKYFLFSKLSNSSIISGDLIFNDKEMKTLNISASFNNIKIFEKRDLRIADIDQGINLAAENILKISNPILLAFYYYKNNKTPERLKCINLSKNILRNLRKTVTIDDLLTIYRLYGLLLIQNNKYQEAINLYNEMIHEFPNFSEGYNDLGIAYIKHENYTEAISCFTEKLKLNNKCVRAKTNIATAFIKIGDYEKAEQYLNEAENIDPQYEVIYHRRGLIKYYKKQFLGAIEDFKKATELNHNYFFSFNSLGNAYDEIENYPEAIYCYKRALMIEPSYSSAHNNLGVTYWRLKEFKKAEKCFENFIELTPNYSAGYINLGLVQKNQKKYQKAIHNFAIAAALSPDESKVYYNWGLTLQEWGKFDNAVEKYNDAILRDPHYEKAITKRDQLLEFMEKK